MSLDLVKLTTAGSVDDGKSTLIGRMLYDANLLYQDQIKEVKKRSKNGIDFSLFTDGLSAEREQGITIDVAYRYFNTKKRRFIVADVPGHEQYTKNMVTGSSMADMALILVDAKNGMTTQSKRHLFIASLMGVPHIMVAVNKMDAAGYKEEVFRKIKSDFLDYSTKLNLKDIQFIPVSATKGDMLVNRGDKMPWYDGNTVFYWLQNTPIASARNIIDFRFPVQYVFRHQGKRFYAGTIEGGRIYEKEEVLVLPSKRTTRIEQILGPGKKLNTGFAPQAVALTLEDQLDVSRGDIIVRTKNVPESFNSFEAILCWFDEKKMKENNSYLLKHTTKKTRCKINNIIYKINMDTLHREKLKEFSLNDIGRVQIKTNDNIFFDPFSKNRGTGSFILIDEITNNTCGAGIILRRAEKDNVEKGKDGAVLWFTGLSGSGKTKIAGELAKELRKRNISLDLLDGDLLRKVLCKDLGFSKEDRDENLRRAAFVASLLSRNGITVLATFIAPYKSQRKMIKEQVKNYHEIFVNAPLEICEKRDPKGLYKKARRGEIKNFTGISDPYEKPENPNLELRTDKLNVQECVKELISYLEKNDLIL